MSADRGSSKTTPIRRNPKPKNSILRDHWKTAPGHTGTVDRVVEALEKRGVKFTEMGVELTRKPR